MPKTTKPAVTGTKRTAAVVDAEWKRKLESERTRLNKQSISLEAELTSVRGRITLLDRLLG